MTVLAQLNCPSVQIGFDWLMIAIGVLPGLIVGLLLGLLIRRRHTMRPIERKMQRLSDMLESPEMRACVAEMGGGDATEVKRRIDEAWTKKEIA